MTPAAQPLTAGLPVGGEVAVLLHSVLDIREQRATEDVL